MAIISALVFLEAERSQALQRTLSGMEGVSLVPLSGSSEVGLLIDSKSLDQAYHLIHDEIPSLAGVLWIRPVYAYFGPEAEGSDLPLN